jgi:phenylacetic acid degradation operon negative regulatory protein
MDGTRDESYGLSGPQSNTPELENTWTLVTFTLPESRRAERHALRTMLGRNGFAPVGRGVWIASGVRYDLTRFQLEESGFTDSVEIFQAHYGGFTKVPEFIRRCWDIDAIAATYRSFIRDVRRRLKHKPGIDSRTFADVIYSSNSWRRINDFADPALPRSALPVNWPRPEAQEVWGELVARFVEPAGRYVDSLLEG